MDREIYSQLIERSNEAFLAEVKANLYHKTAKDI